MRSLRQLLNERHSVRRFSDVPLDVELPVDLAWAGLGRNKFKYTAPSAGALNPMKLYLLVRQVYDHDPYSVWSYNADHNVLRYHCTLKRSEFDSISGSNAFQTAPLSILLSADVECTARKYVGRAMRYIYIECGHVAQNILLYAQSIGLGGVPIGAVQDSRVQQILDIPELPCYLVSLGIPEM